ncbi:MAG: hypothetical protein ACXVQJ_00460 [Actinomycetota bacterium]
MREYTITSTHPTFRMPDPWDNGGLRDRLAGRSAPGSSVLAELRTAMEERASQEATAGTRSRRGRHRATR